MPAMRVTGLVTGTPCTPLLLENAALLDKVEKSKLVDPVATVNAVEAAMIDARKIAC
jgi:hypothetical protein